MRCPRGHGSRRGDRTARVPARPSSHSKVCAAAMRIASFSDVHANLPALEATLADIEAAGVDARYALGDLVGYAPWPNETLERLQAEGLPIVMGNYDDGTGSAATSAAAPVSRNATRPRATPASPGPKPTQESRTRRGCGRCTPRSGSRPTASAICSCTEAPAGSTSTSTRTSRTRRSRGSRPVRTPTSSCAVTPTRRTTRLSPAPGSSTWAPPGSPRTAIRAGAGPPGHDRGHRGVPARRVRRGGGCGGDRGHRPPD
jgi:hypothetical protein